MAITVEHSGAVACFSCQFPLPLAEVTSFEGVRCPRCHSLQRGRAFRATFMPPVSEVAPPISTPGEAACYQHTTKRAAVPCDRCGRFLCALCRMTVGAQNLCPSCIAVARRRNSPRWVARRLNLDSVALATALVPMLGVWTTLVGGPVAIYLGIRALSQEPGPVPRGRWRAILALVMGVLQVVAWILLLVTVFGTVLFRGGRLG